MKYCVKCGTQLHDDAMFCSKCGNKTESGGYKKAETENKAKTAVFSAETRVSFRNLAKIFMIISTAIGSLAYLIPLAWCLPLTLHYIDKIKNNEDVSLEFKVCSLIFVSPIAGIFMLLDSDFNNM